MDDLFIKTFGRFNMWGMTMDSGYSSKKFLGGNHYLTESMSNRKVSSADMGMKTTGDDDLFYSLEEDTGDHIRHA